MTGRPRVFHIQRHADPSGVSGLGTVAWGVQWPDLHVAVRWIDPIRGSTAVWQRIEDVESVHGHGGSSVIVWEIDQAATDMANAVSHWHDEAADELARLRTGLTSLCAVHTQAVPVPAIRELLDCEAT